LRPTPYLEDEVVVFVSSGDRVAQLYPQAPGPSFVTFNASQGCGGGVLTISDSNIVYSILEMHYNDTPRLARSVPVGLSEAQVQYKVGAQGSIEFSIH
jgi:hypothetical protein